MDLRCPLAWPGRSLSLWGHDWPVIPCAHSVQDECDNENTMQAVWFGIVWHYNLLLEELLGHVKPFDDPSLSIFAGSEAM